MPLHQSTALSGVIQHVFAHRFTLEADGQVHLADLTPKGVEAFPLETGLAVSLEGEQRPSEIKVTRISAAGRDPVAIEHKKPHHPKKDGPKKDGADDKHLAPVDLGPILAAVTAAGWTVVGEPRRKPKHIEVAAQRDKSSLTELHVDLDGKIYKEKPADPTKWSKRPEAA